MKIPNTLVWAGVVVKERCVVKLMERLLYCRDEDAELPEDGVGGGVGATKDSDSESDSANSSDSDQDSDDSFGSD